MRAETEAEAAAGVRVGSEVGEGEGVEGEARVGVEPGVVATTAVVEKGKGKGGGGSGGGKKKKKSTSRGGVSKPLGGSGGGGGSSSGGEKGKRAAGGGGGSGGGGGAGKRKRSGGDEADALQGLVRVAFSGLQPGDRQVGGGRAWVIYILYIYYMYYIYARFLWRDRSVSCLRAPHAMFFFCN